MRFVDRPLNCSLSVRIPFIRVNPWQTPDFCPSLWRIVLAKGWMSEAQARHVQGKINEIGRMAGLWRRASGRDG